MNGEHREHDLNALAAHLEGRLEKAERQRMVAHLSDCASCRETAALLARSWDGVRPQPGVRKALSPVAAMARSPWLALAAVLLVASAVTFQLLPTPPALPPAGAGVQPGPTPEAARPGESPPLPGIADAPRARARAAPPEAGIDERLLVKRGGARHVEGKTFRLAGGQWVDSSFNPAEVLPVVEVTGPVERAKLLGRVPGLTPYAALGESVVVVFEGTVYRFRP